MLCSMNVDTDLVCAVFIIALGAIIGTCRNCGARLGRKAIFGRMGAMIRRCVGVVLLVAAVVVVLASTNIQDVPGPMDGVKPEFAFEFSIPFVILAVILAAAGTLSLASSMNSTMVGRDSVET
jgi:hypothetical protein